MARDASAKDTSMMAWCSAVGDCARLKRLATAVASHSPSYSMGACHSAVMKESLFLPASLNGMPTACKDCKLTGSFSNLQGCTADVQRLQE